MMQYFLVFKPKSGLVKVADISHEFESENYLFESDGNEKAISEAERFTNEESGRPIKLLKLEGEKKEVIKIW